MTTVRSSGVSTEPMSLNFSDCAQPPSGAVQYCQVKATSAEVTGVPSDHTRPSFSFQVMVVRSSDTPPFSTVGISSASHGTMVPFSL